ncbi:MAG: hypothetical protein WB992_25680, partial [Bryobacteraceae bacterium]
SYPVRLFRATLEAKGYLHFYASEYLKITHVSDVLHNWALMLAVNDVRSDPEQSHLQNLRGINFYCTPGAPMAVARRTYKRNPVPEDTGAGKMGLMEIEYYLPGSTFQFYTLSRDGSPPPSMFHYGKKRVPCQLSPDPRSSGWEGSTLPFRAHDTVDVRRVSHLVNPLDYDAITNVSYAKKVPMKPSPLYYLAANFARVLLADRMKVVVPNLEASIEWS